jgi:phosphoadenosine phosphosulfate reductase
MKVYFPATDRILVAYSGGKDSLVLSDLAVKRIENVGLFFMYFIAGLDYTEHWCSFAEKRWGVKIYRCLHWGTSYLLRDGVFCNPYEAARLSLRDIEASARHHFNWPHAWVASGIRLNDSLERRGMLNSWSAGYQLLTSRRCAPIAEFTERDVYAYLQRAKLPIPDMGVMARSHGIDLSPLSMHWMRQTWPDDYKRILKVFPHAAGQADRYDYFKEQRRRAKENRVPKVRVPRGSAKRSEDGSVQSAQDRQVCT